MPRPMPVSNSDADRDRLNVAMHWYWFQVLTMRVRCSSGQRTWKPPSRRSHDAPNDANPASTACRRGPPLEDGLASAGVDRAGGGELRLAVLDEGEHEGQLLRLARRQVERHLVGAHGMPAVGDRPAGRSRERNARLVQALVHADEGVACRVEPGDRDGAGEHRRVVVALSQLRHVVDRAALDDDLADRERALVVGHVDEGLVEGELHERVQARLPSVARDVAHGDLPELDVLAGGDEQELLDLEAVPRRP